MRTADLPDTPLASFTPDIPGEIDGIRDILREEFAKQPIFSTPEARDAAFQAIDSSLAQVNVMEFDRGEATRNEAETVAKVLQIISRDSDRHYAMRALCYLRLIGKEGRTFEELGEVLGTTRAAVNNCYRELQDRLGGIPSRGDKSPEAREKYAHRRTGQRRIRPLWSGSSAWLSALRPVPVTP